MANRVIQCAQTWFKPIYRQLRKSLLEQPVIHADETVVQVLKEEGKPARPNPACGCMPAAKGAGNRSVILNTCRIAMVGIQPRCSRTSEAVW